MSCSVSGGCNSNKDSGCTKHNTFDWLALLPAHDNGENHLGSNNRRRSFRRNNNRR